MVAISNFMTGNYLCQPGGGHDGVSFLLEVVVVTVAFCVVVVLLTSVDAMLSFHRYCHSNNKNKTKGLKNAKK